MIGSVRAWLPALLLAGVFARSLYGTPPLLLGAAAIPAFLYALLVLRLDRGGREPASLLVAVFLWGAVVAAGVALVLNDLMSDWLRPHADERVAAVFGGSIIEEAAKGLALGLLYWLRRDEFDGVLDGVVYGAMIGIGFAMTENLSYFTLAMIQGGSSGFLQSIYTRALVGGFNHAAFTACTGAGWGYLRQGGTYRAVVVGFAVAVAQHALWNGIASITVEQLLCGAGSTGICLASPPSFSLLVMIPLVVLGFVGPGGITLILIARLSVPTSSRQH